MSPSTTQQKPTHSRKRTSRLIRIFGVFLLGILAWAAVTAWNQNGKLNQNKAQLNELKAKLADVNRVNSEVTQEVGRLNDKEYIEEIARKELHMGKSGETFFGVPRTNP